LEIELGRNALSSPERGFRLALNKKKKKKLLCSFT